MQRSVPEGVCLALLLLWLVTLPLPFGSVVEGARPSLLVVPLVLAIAAALIRLEATRDRSLSAQPTRPWIIWGVGALAFIAVTALQLVPLPPAMLRVISPQSEVLWSEASRIAVLGGGRARTLYPISIDPSATTFELVRFVSLLAVFSAFALLVRSHTRRIAVASAISLGAIFQVFYGVREASLGRYAIWGWVNKLIFNRVTGTFVNPNHYGHYLAIALPMAVFLGAIAWRESGAHREHSWRRLALIMERRPWLGAASAFAAILCVAGVLLSQSRGATLALTAGVLAVAAFIPGKRVARVAFASGAVVVFLAALVLFLGPERTVGRFVPTALERETFVGRKIGISAAAGLWMRFPILGSGLGTFNRVVFMTQDRDIERTYHHAHNDYAELLATAGTVGAILAIGVLAGGYLALVRMTFGREGADLSWRRRTFQASVLASITIAAVHALFDFNYFIPANPATLAAMAGAAVASTDRDKRSRR